MWQRVPTSSLAIRNPRREALGWTLYAVAFVGAATVVGYLVQRWPSPLLGAWKLNQDVWYAGGLKIGLLLIVPSLIFRWSGYRMSALTYAKRANVLSTVAWFFAGALINVGHLSRIQPAFLGFSPRDLVVRLPVAIVLPLFTAGIPEEVVYRGILQLGSRWLMDAW